MFSFLQKPYPSKLGLKNGIQSAFGVSLFMVIFFLVFKPFGLGNLPTGILFKVVLFFSLVNAVATFLVIYGFSFLFPKFYNEDDWTIGREIILFLVLFLFISGGCSLVNIFYDFMPANFNTFLRVFLYVLAFGILPVGFSIMNKYNSQLRKNLAEAQAINQALSKGEQNISKEKANLIKLHSDNKKEELLLNVKQFYFAESAANYVTLYYKNENAIQKQMLRTTMKKISSDLEGNSQIIRCHRSFILNLNHVEKVVGDSRAYEITMKDNAGKIPVSRSYIPTIKSVLNIP